MTQIGNPNPGLPEFKYINRIPIIEVARKIGLQVNDDGKIVCPQSNDHAPGTTSFLTVVSSTNRAVCVICETPLMNVLDMVKRFGRFRTLRETAEYVAIDFEVPRIPKGSHLNNPKGDTVPPACRNPITLLVTPGIWSQLSVSSQRLIPALLDRANWQDGVEERVFHLSYFAMMRFSGIDSPNSISEALDELEAIGWLERFPVPRRGNSPVKDTASYRLKPLSERVRKLADSTASNFGEAIQEEKANRREKRRKRDYQRMFGIDPP